MNEQELTKRCLKKDKKAWSLFIDKYSRLVYWAIRRQMSIAKLEHGQADIDDIFQEVFLTILKGDKLLQLKNPKKLSGWLAMIASNRTLNFLCRRVNRVQNLDVDNLLFRDNSVKQDLLNREITYLVQEIVGSLSNKEKLIISLNLFQEKTHKEIASILGMPINTVSTVIARTKEKLKKELKNKGIGENF
jgi:RNA polymerase sigma-70 factor (ECF subfamily)